MVSANDPLDSFFNSIQHLKDAISPLELGIKKAVKGLETCMAVHQKNGNYLELNGNGNGKSSRKMQIFSVKKKSNGINNNSNNNRVDNSYSYEQCVVSEEKKKALLSIEVPMKIFLGMFSPKLGSGKVGVVSNKGVKQRDLDKDDGSRMNCLQFAVIWSLLVNGIVQALPSLFKAGKKQIQKVGDDDKGHLSSCAYGLKSKAVCEFKQKEAKSLSVNVYENECVTHEGKYVSHECFIGFMFDNLI